MSRHRSHPVHATAILSVLLFLVVAGAAACDEDGKTAPERCADPPLPIFDIQSAGAPADDNAQYPCVTKVGHSINQQGPAKAPTSTAGSAGKAATGNAGEGGSAATAGAGAGGAP